MKHVLIIIAVMVVAASVVVSQSHTSSEDEIKVADKWWAEYFRRNCTDPKQILETVLAGDYIFIDNAGNVFTKTDYLKKVPCDEGWLSNADEMKVRVYGDTAVVTGRLKLETVAERNPKYERSFRYTNVYVRKPKRWELVSTQISLISD